ncbi:MAG: serine/threonine-protein kinase RsbW [Thermoleophilaceae bacterium]|nr:serine/threonine-protein kinase RsbW [Thermoleophilaceae bacterium]
MQAHRLHTRNDFGTEAADGVRAAGRHPGRGSGGGPSRSGGPGISVNLQPGAAAAAEARAALSVLDGIIDRCILDDIRLLVSELVTNSVRHSGARGRESVRLDVMTRRGAVRVEVTDPGAGFEPRARSKSRDEPGGWGLHLVERIAARWGVATGRRTRVWFELDC